MNTRSEAKEENINTYKNGLEFLEPLHSEEKLNSFFNARPDIVKPLKGEIINAEEFINILYIFNTADIPITNSLIRKLIKSQANLLKTANTIFQLLKSAKITIQSISDKSVLNDVIINAAVDVHDSIINAVINVNDASFYGQEVAKVFAYLLSKESIALFTPELIKAVSEIRHSGDYIAVALTELEKENVDISDKVINFVNGYNPTANASILLRFHHADINLTPEFVDSIHSLAKMTNISERDYCIKQIIALKKQHKELLTDKIVKIAIEAPSVCRNDIVSALLKLNKAKININLEGFARFHYKELPAVVKDLISLQENYGALLTDEILHVAVKHGDREGGAIAEALIISKQAGIPINLEKFTRNRNMPTLSVAFSQLQQHHIHINLESLAEDNYQDLPSVVDTFLTLKNESPNSDLFKFLVNSSAKIPMTKSFANYFYFHNDHMEYMSDIIAGFALLKEANFSLTSDLQKSFFNSLRITNPADAKEKIQNSFQQFLARIIKEDDQENAANVECLKQILQEMPGESTMEYKAENGLTRISEQKRVLTKKGILECVSAFFQPLPLVEPNLHQETPVPDSERQEARMKIV